MMLDFGKINAIKRKGTPNPKCLQYFYSTFKINIFESYVYYSLLSFFDEFCIMCCLWIPFISPVRNLSCLSKVYLILLCVVPRIEIWAL